MPCPIRYHFTQRFSVPARKAYEWCTDYDPSDHALMGEVGAERQINWLTDSTVILTDAFLVGGSKVEKQKLVQLYPNQLFWVSTHLAGPYKYSQFLYAIRAVGGKASRLSFTGLQLEYEKKMSEAEVKQLADKLCKDDAQAWKLLAKAMEKDLGKKTQK
ncbi:MAG: hypothetical protein ACE14S_00150 [Candidatus Bathyarchaeia archaeon]